MPYATQTQEEIMAMPVHDWLEAEAHVYMWVTNSEMRNGIALFEHWGVEYKSTLTWLKEGKDGRPRIGMGYYTGETGIGPLPRRVPNRFHDNSPPCCDFPPSNFKER